MSRRVGTVVVGAGPAGLATSRHLAAVIPVDTNVAHKVKGWQHMPLPAIRAWGGRSVVVPGGGGIGSRLVQRELRSVLGDPTLRYLTWLDETGGYVDEFEPQLTIGLLMDSLELQSILEGDPPGRGPLNEPLMADEEDGRLVDAHSLDSVDFLGQQARWRKPQVAAQGQRAHWRAIEEHCLGFRHSHVRLAVPLQSNDLVNEGRLRPRSVLAHRLVQGDDVSSCLLDHRYTVDLQQAQHGGLSSSRRASQDVSGHAELHVVSMGFDEAATRRAINLRRHATALG